MYHDTVTGFDEQALDGKHTDTNFGGVGRAENSRTEGCLYNSISTACLKGEEAVVFLDSDSGDSLFLTRHEAQPARTARRQRPEENALNPFVAIEPFCENEESSSSHRSWEIPLKPRRSRKTSQQRWRRHNRKYLYRRESFTFEHAALGGFFKCVTKIKAGAASEGVSVSKRPEQHYKDTRGHISPLPDSDEGEDNEDRSDIKIVNLQDFIPGYKSARKGYNPWLEGNDTLGTVTEETKDVPKTAPTILGSCSGLLGSDREAGSSENECYESDSESQPVQCSSEATSRCESDVLDACFRQDETRRKARRASHPDSELNTGVEKLGDLGLDLDLQGSVHEDRLTVTDLVYAETEDIEIDTVEDIIQRVMAAQPAGLLREKKESRRKEMDDEEPVDRPLDSVPEEEGTAGCTAEPDRHTQPPRDCHHQTQDKEYCSIAGEGEHSILIFSVPESVGDSAACDVACEEGIRKKKNKRKKDKNGNVEEYVNEPPPETLSLHLTHDKERSSGAGVGERSLISSLPEPVGDSAAGDIACEEGIRKKKKKKRRKKDSTGDVEEHISGPPSASETLSDSLHLLHNRERSSGAGGGEHALFIPNVPGPVGDSASGDVVCEEGIRKKNRKERKKDKNGNVEEYVNEPPPETLSDSLHLTHDREINSGAGERSLIISSVPDPVVYSASGDVIIKEGIRKKKDNSGNVVEHVNKPPSCTLKERQPKTQDRDRSSRAGEGGRSHSNSSRPEPVNDSASCDVTCEGVIRKKKRKRENCENTEEHMLPHMLKDNWHQTKDKEKSTRVGVTGFSQLHSSSPEPVNGSVSCEVACEERMRKKIKKRKGDDNADVCEQVRKPLSHTLSESKRQTKDKEKRFGAGEAERSHLSSSIPEPVSDSGDVIHHKGLRKKKRKRDSSGNVKERIGEPPSHTLKDSLHQTQCKPGEGERSHLNSSIPEQVGASSDIHPEGIRRKNKRRRDKSGNEDVRVRKKTSCILEDSRDSADCVREYSHFSSTVTEPIGDSRIGDSFCEERKRKCKKKEKKAGRE